MFQWPFDAAPSHQLRAMAESVEALKQTAQNDRHAEEAEREFDFAKRLLTRLLIS
jgi:hypothetical protein